MIIPTRIWEFAITAMVIIIAPGPSVLFIIARAIAWGRKSAVWTAAGNVSGALVLSALVALGLGPILQRSDLAYATVQWGGGTYLIYLGIGAIRHRKAHAADVTQKNLSRPTALKSMREGFWVGVLNPKTLVFFAAVLPQFIDRERGSVTAQLLFLGLLFAIMALISDGSWGLLAGTARDWLATDAGRLTTLRATGGVVMVTLGALVLVATIRHALG